MNLRQIHNTLISGRFSVIIFIVLVVIMRLITQPDLSSIAFWAALLLQIGIALALLQVNYVFTIIRTRTMLPAVFYLLMTGSFPIFYTEWQGSVAASGALIGLVFLFSSYQNPDSQKNALNIGIILTLCSFAWPPLLFLFPLFWYGLYVFQSLNFKTFFASIIGVIVVYLFAFVWGLYNGGIQVFIEILPHTEELFVIHPFNLNVQDIVVFGLLFVLFIIAGFNIFVSGLSEKIKTGTYLKFLYTTSICIALVMPFQCEWKIQWTLLIYTPVIFILSHFFTLSTRKITSWILVVFILFFIGMYIWQVL